MNRCGERGVFLLEAVLALAVLGVVVSLVARLQSTSFGIWKRARAELYGTVLAENLIAEVADPFHEHKPGGKVDIKGTRFEWSREVSYWEGMRRADVSVFWEAGGVPGRIHLVGEHYEGTRESEEESKS